MAKISTRAVKTPGKPEKKSRKKRIEVSPRGSGYDSAPLLLEEAPDLEKLIADPPIIQKPTEQNREFWASAEASALPGAGQTDVGGGSHYYQPGDFGRW